MIVVDTTDTMKRGITRDVRENVTPVSTINFIEQTFFLNKLHTLIITALSSCCKGILLFNSLGEGVCSASGSCSDICVTSSQSDFFTCLCPTNTFNELTIDRLSCQGMLLINELHRYFDYKLLHVHYILKKLSPTFGRSFLNKWFIKTNKVY